MIEVRSVSKFFGSKKAVRDLSFKIHEGEIVGLLGLNGAGKSTVLKILGCFLDPSMGDALVGGFSVTEDPQSVRRLIGYLPDKPPLYEEMKTRDYLQFVARLKNVSSSNIASYVEEALQKTNLQEVTDYRLGELSHGFQQRVGIAQALVHKPKILILDEPINGLDPVQIIEMRDLILSLRGAHTVVLSSHILSEITRTCDRILVIDRGQLVAEGSEDQLRGKASQTLAIDVEVREVSENLINKIKMLPSVKQVDGQLGSGKISLLCTDDIRSLVAKTIIDSGGELLALRRKDAELETLFLKLVKGGN
jgi:ABC-2 type transport system ATP-binding protein